MDDKNLRKKGLDQACKELDEARKILMDQPDESFRPVLNGIDSALSWIDAVRSAT